MEAKISGLARGVALGVIVMTPRAPICQGFTPLQYRSAGCIIFKSPAGRTARGSASTFAVLRKQHSRRTKSLMPTPVFPTAYKVIVKGSMFSIPIENVWYVQGPDPFDTTAAADIADVFQTGYGAILANLSQDVSYSEIEVTNLGGVATGQYILNITPPDTGDIGVGALPGSVALCVTLRSALAGRRFRGRKFFSGLDEGAVTGNVVDATVAEAIRAAVGSLASSLTSIGHPMSIFSTVGVTLVPVTTVTLTDLRVDSQRGRLR